MYNDILANTYTKKSNKQKVWYSYLKRTVYVKLILGLPFKCQALISNGVQLKKSRQKERRCRSLFYSLHMLPFYDIAPWILFFFNLNMVVRNKTGTIRLSTKHLQFLQCCNIFNLTVDYFRPICDNKMGFIFLNCIGSF